jgi:hypothetical protein
MALAYLEEGAGTDFDADMVAAFGSMMRGANRQYVRMNPDGMTEGPTDGTKDATGGCHPERRRGISGNHRRPA